MIRILRALAVLGFAASSLLHAQGQTQPTDDLESVAFVSGTCERMSVVGEDLSWACRGPLMNTRYRSGRLSFAIPTDDDLLLSFSGMDLWEEGDRIMLRLDRITVATSASPTAATETAEGICEFSDFFAGPARLVCAGRTPSGDFIATFASDGKPPRLEQF